MGRDGDIAAGGTLESAEATLRPLSACVAGAGIMTLGVLQFLGDVWDTVPAPAREDLLTATRVAFLGFLFALGALVLAWLARRVVGAAWMGLANLVGLFAFAGSAFLVARNVSRALALAMPGLDALPSDDIALYVALSACALILLALGLVLAGLRRLVTGSGS